MRYTFVNLTSQPYRLLRSDGTVLDVLPSGTVATISLSSRIAYKDGYEVVEEKKPKIAGIPHYEIGNIYIVDQVIAEYVRRHDCFYAVADGSYHKLIRPYLGPA